jgi:hypothetical protein
LGYLYWRERILVSIPVVVIFSVMAAMLTSRGSGLNRLEIWQTVWMNFTPFGYGLGTFKTVFPNYEFAHNEFFQLVFELGVGALFFLGVIAYVLRHTPILERSILAAWCGAALVWEPLQLPATALVFALVAGRAYGVFARSHVAQSDSRVEGLSGFYNAGADWPAEVRLVAASRSVVSAGP